MLHIVYCTCIKYNIYVFVILFEMLSQSSTPWKSILTSLPLMVNIISQIGYNWGMYTISLQAPTYFKFVLGFDLKQVSWFNRDLKFKKIVYICFTFRQVFGLVYHICFCGRLHSVLVVYVII